MITENPMTCSELDDLLAGYFEEDLDAAGRARVEQHASTCLRCQSLIRDIDDVRATAASLPDLSPSRDLWKNIDARIQPEVVSIGVSHGRGISRRWLAAAAALLIVASSGVTYFATSRMVGNAPAVAASGSPPRDIRLGGATVEAPAAEVAVEAAPDQTERRVASENLNPPQRPGGEAQAAARGTTLTVSRPSVAPSASEIELSNEITRLQTVLEQRKGQLDPATVKVVEDNLALIDRAVSQARAALSADPASGFLNDRMDDALQKKLELLRTVAMLPSTT